MRIQSAAVEPAKLVPNRRNESLTPAAQRDQLVLLDKLNRRSSAALMELRMVETGVRAEVARPL